MRAPLSPHPASSRTRPSKQLKTPPCTRAYAMENVGGGGQKGPPKTPPEFFKLYCGFFALLIMAAMVVNESPSSNICFSSAKHCSVFSGGVSRATSPVRPQATTIPNRPRHLGQSMMPSAKPKPSPANFS